MLHTTPRFVSVFVVASLFSLSACDLTNTDTSAPDPIASDVFAMDTNLFSSNANVKQTGPHFTNAALRVLPVSLVLTAHMIIPSVVTGAALQAVPVLSDNKWAWSSAVTHANQSIEFVLTANTLGLNTDWEMTVTYFDAGTSQIYEDFVLYTAQTRNNGTEGTWNLFYNIDGVRTNVLNASFTRSNPSQKSVTFSIPLGAQNNAGDAVTYDVIESTRVFTWAPAGSTSETMVIWNKSTAEGSLVAPNYNGGEPACWDSTRADVPCPN